MAVVTAHQFNLASGGAATHHNPPGDADQIGILELHAGTLIAVVEKGIDSGAAQAVVDLLGEAHLLGILGASAHHDHLEGGDRQRPTDAVGIVVLLNRRLGQP